MYANDTGNRTTWKIVIIYNMLRWGIVKILHIFRYYGDICLWRMSRNLGLSWPVGGRYRNQLPTRQLSHSLYLTGVYTKHVASTDKDLSNKLSRTILSGGLSLQCIRRNEREITCECGPYSPNTTKNMTTIFFSFTVNTAQPSTI